MSYALRFAGRCFPTYHRGMIITIDKSGRLVVPKQYREQLNLVAGTELEVDATSDCITLRKASSEPELVRKHGLLIHHGPHQVSLDTGEFVRAERQERLHRLGGHGR